MRAKIIFCTAVSAATLAVILLALISPVAHHKKLKKQQSRPWLALSLYIQQPHTQIQNPKPKPTRNSDTRAFVFHRTLTEGPENTSRVVGKAQGFIIPVAHFDRSAFNIIYLTFDTPEFAGSLSVQAKHLTNKGKEELTVVGGTGSFAFARGLAIFAKRDSQESDVDSMYHLKLQLKFPNQVKTTPG